MPSTAHRPRRRRARSRADLKHPSADPEKPTNPIRVIGALCWVLLVVAGVGCLLVAALFATSPGPTSLGPASEQVSTIGATAIAVAFTWALAARTGGRPLIFGLLAAVIGGMVLLTDHDGLRAGASVMTCAVGAVLGMLVTVPAVRIRQAVRETVIAFGVATIGAAASIGFLPLIDLARFRYATLAVALFIAFVLAYRIGAGVHGLGRRGLVVVLGGGALLATGLVYAELLRVYGTPGLIDVLIDAAAWSDRIFGGHPRPLPAVLGLPTLVWGVHLRARRRQGWWACAFGVTGLAPIARVLAEPGLSDVATLATLGTTLVTGVVIGILVISLDLLLIGSRGRGARTAERDHAVRPEPGRSRPLL